MSYEITTSPPVISCCQLKHGAEQRDEYLKKNIKRKTRIRTQRWRKEFMNEDRRDFGTQND